LNISVKITLFQLLFLCSINAASPQDFPDFRAASPEGTDLLSKNPTLLESDGGTIIRMSDGRLIILGVGSVSVKKVATEESGKEKIRQRTVAENKARAKLLAQIKAVHVQSTTKSESKLKIIQQNGQEFAETTDTLDEEIIAKVSGTISELEPLATWFSPERDIFYLALWKIIKPR